MRITPRSLEAMSQGWPSRWNTLIAKTVLVVVGGLVPCQSLAQDPPVPGPAVQGSVRSYDPRAISDSVPSDTFLEERARSIFTVARRRWLEVDSSIRSYEAIIRSRAAVSIRTPLKDRTLFRAEAAARARWSSDSTLVVQMLAANEVTPEGPAPAGALEFTESVFDPKSDRLYFGFGPDPDSSDRTESDAPVTEEEEEFNVEFEHPIAPGSEEHYQYQVSDSIRLSLPDGRSLQAVALELIPRQRSGRLLSGKLWIEPETGALVRALYRLASEFDVEAELARDDDVNLRLVPGMFRPLEFDVSMVVVEYALWDFRFWMPSRIRMEGFARAGIVRVPGAVEQSYRILDVVGADDQAIQEDPSEVAERWRTDGEYGAFREMERPEPLDSEADSLDTGRTRGDPGERDRYERDERYRTVHLLVPVNPEDLHTSELLPPPIWDDAAGFTSAAQLEEFLGDLANLSAPETDRSRLRWRSGPEIGELTRYNRAEGFSLGARAEWTTTTGFGPIGLSGSGWLGLGTWVPDARLDLGWETARHRLTLSGYHRVDEVDPRARSLSMGNSLTALLFGRDDGEYFRASGTRVGWEPRGVRRGWYRLSLSAERHRALPNEVDWSFAEVFGGDETPFRPALEAEKATELAAAVLLEPWWGTDPRSSQGGLEILLHGAGGDFDWFRARAVGRLAVPLVRGVRAGVELGGGQLWGDAPLQRLWFLGGAHTLRGYGGASAVGTRYVRAKVELAREVGAGRWAVFSDWGWAGDDHRVDLNDGLLSAGVGLSLLDGLIRFDLARAVRPPTGWRAELYLDSLL